MVLLSSTNSIQTQSLKVSSRVFKILLFSLRRPISVIIFVFKNLKLIAIQITRESLKVGSVDPFIYAFVIE